MASTCWPWFSAKYRALAAEPWTKTIIKAGAAVDDKGNIPIKPEELRARAEAQLAQIAPQALVMIGGRLSLETYTYARYMASEALGNQSTVEERVAVGEALKNRTAKGASIYKRLTPSGYYGPIHASDSYCESIGKGPCEGKHNVCCNPFNRWAATTRDPSVMTIMLAHLVTSGASGNFTNGADDQANMLAYGLDYGKRWVTNHAKNGEYWVGHLPGVDHRKTFLYFTADPVTRSAAGSTLLQRGLAALTEQPAWPPMTEVCSTGPGPSKSGKGSDVLLAVLGLAVGVVGGIYFNRWLAGGVALGAINVKQKQPDRLKKFRLIDSEKVREGTYKFTVDAGRDGELRVIVYPEPSPMSVFGSGSIQWLEADLSDKQRQLLRREVARLSNLKGSLLGEITGRPLNGAPLGEITAARYIEDESLPVSERLKTVRVTAKQKANEILMDRIATRSYWSERDDAAYDRMTERERTQVNDQLEKQANRLAKLLGYSQAWSS